MSTVSYRERDREREWETDSYRGSRDRNSKTYTTVKRYKVPERDYDDDDRYETDVKVTTSRGGRDRSRSNVRETVVEKDVDRRTSDYHRYSRDDTSNDVREIRIERDVSRDPPRRERERERDDDYELERYTRTTDYYREPERSPQAIYIRNEAPQPIIIREPARQTEVSYRERETEREDTRSDYAESRQLARREPSPEPDEDYYYERRVRRVSKREEDDNDDYRSQREVAPRDSASQNSRDEYSEDESYYKKTTESYGRDQSPHHKRHLAEGAVAGLGAAALLRHHKRKEGEHPGSWGRLAGGAALGAVAAEGITRARSHFGRDRSRARSGSRERDFTSGGRPSSRERSESPTWFERMGDRWHDQSNLAKFGEVAALGALAAYAARRGRGKVAERRSRGISGDRGRSSSRGPAEGAHHTRNTMIKAGLGSAAAAAVVEKIRSRSRGARAHSHGRQALQAAGVGLGGAALAGLYERNKDPKRDEPRGRSISRSPSRSRSVPYAEGQRGMGNDQNLIEYGGDPIAPDGREAYRGRGYSGSQSPPRLRSRSRDAGLEHLGGAAAAGGVAGAAAHAADERRRRRREERDMRQDDRQGPNNQPPYGFGPYAQAPPPTNMPTQPPFQQQQQQPPPQQGPGQFYPHNNSFPPPPNNPYSPTPNIINSNYPPPHEPTDYPANPSYAPPQGPQAYPSQGYPPQNTTYRGPQSGPNVSQTPARYLPVSLALPHDAGSRTISSDQSHMNDHRKSVQFNMDLQQAEAPHYPTETEDDEVQELSSEAGSENEPLRPRVYRGYSDDDQHLQKLQNHSQHVTEDRQLDSPEVSNHRRDLSPPDSLDLTSHQRTLNPPRDADRHAHNEHPRGRNIQAVEDDPYSSHRVRPRDEDLSEEESREPHRNRDETKRKRRHRRRHSVDGTPSTSRRERPRHHRDSSVDSDATVDMPDRFDQDETKKPDQGGEDNFQERFNNLLSGQGKAGKLFHRLTRGRFADLANNDSRRDPAARSKR